MNRIPPQPGQPRDEIVAVQVQALRMALREPYAIAYDSFDHTDNLLLRLRTDTGLEGIGCAAPAAEVTGESPPAATAALDLASGALLRQAVMSARLPREIEADLDSCPAARAAVDIALLDLQARCRGLPLWRHLGGRLRPMMTSVTLGIAPLRQTLERAGELTRRGVRALKIKGGADVEADIETVRALRRDLGGAVELRFDANQGYGFEQTVHFATATAAVGLSLLEQPLAIGREDDWLRLRERIDTAYASTAQAPGPPPLMADESLLSVSDATRLATTGGVEAFNVKLMKCGGIRPAAEIAGIAARAGIKVMLSCMDEAAVGIAAALHLALALPGIRWIDLDGHLDLLDDPTDGAVQLIDGSLIPKPGPGLAVTLQP